LGTLSSERYICIHGHFYQPPRQNLGWKLIEQQDSAYPYHDWNERITDQCYTPNTAAHILQDGLLYKLCNNYAWTSWDFGPTLLSWLETKQPETYQAIVESDKRKPEKFSGSRLGNGSGIQPYDFAFSGQ